ncbi:uncharacterized protein N7446_005682 [Penicillium canescens]|uniref:Ribosomal protein S17 n=1 Tax=Penicillium canescens TaxID=5083 RepID=A0AAD6II96_PENCN|nr:uncharacterized protein N7446_005682 [Penicillium canescens]KAJ6050075.1 hypothetical protein N7444_006791 [Penicillium canescens]KAJ6051052.1 hypothetical protein N7460_001586 [Penicillium canescens]KAJ6061562.1 hypothetical protein N7446_005682 [Penicillium canescens]
MLPREILEISTANTSSSQTLGKHHHHHNPFRVLRSPDPTSLNNLTRIHQESSHQPPKPTTMAPNHLLRAAMPLRASMTPLSLTRPTLLQTTQITTPLRQKTTSTKPTPTTATPNTLTVPPRLRNYASVLKTGTVVSVGRMDRTVRVCHRHNTYDRHIGKYYPKETHYLVSDPRNSLRDGDVIEFSSGAPKSKHVHHVVERIITPFGVGISERPAVLSRAERDAAREARWAEKYVRREARILGREVDLRAEAMEMAAKRGRLLMRLSGRGCLLLS